MRLACQCKQLCVLDILLGSDRRHMDSLGAGRSYSFPSSLRILRVEVPFNLQRGMFRDVSMLEFLAIQDNALMDEHKACPILSYTHWHGLGNFSRILRTEALLGYRYFITQCCSATKVSLSAFQQCHSSKLFYSIDSQDLKCARFG